MCKGAKSKFVYVVSVRNTCSARQTVTKRKNRSFPFRAVFSCKSKMKHLPSIMKKHAISH